MALLLRNIWRYTANVALVLSSLSISCIICEIILRLMTPGIGFAWRNFATDPVNIVRMNSAVEHDPLLGYVHKPNLMSVGLGPLGNRIPYITKADDAVPPVPERPILAIGASFTYGSEVAANESWPAYLEALAGVPVVNAGVGGYGLDQMVLSAERLIDRVKPRLLILAFAPQEMNRVRASVFAGSQKPFFEIVDGELVLRNTPVPEYRPSATAVGAFRSIFGYAYLLEWAAQSLAISDRWHASTWEVKYETVNGVAVSCLLMKRLKQLSERSDVPAVVAGLYARAHFVPEGRTRTEEGFTVLECARTQRIPVIDTYDIFREVLPANQAGDFSRYYVNGIGHMTPEANRIVAKHIASGLRTAFPDLPGNPLGPNPD
jgi:hypothetical protein